MVAQNKVSAAVISFFSYNFWEAYGATSAKVGYDMIFDIVPDLIITDAIMPVIGGFQLIKMVKKTCLFCTAVLEKLKFADLFVKSSSISKGLI